MGPVGTISVVPQGDSQSNCEPVFFKTREGSTIDNACGPFGPAKYIPAYMHTYMHTDILTYIHKYIHTIIHTYTPHMHT